MLVQLQIIPVLYPPENKATRIDVLTNKFKYSQCLP